MNLSELSAKLAHGLPESQAARVEAAMARLPALYGEGRLGSGEPILDHTFGMAAIVAELQMDADSRIAALFFAIHAQQPTIAHSVLESFGPIVSALVEGLHRLNGLSVAKLEKATHTPLEIRAQTEILRKMVLAMVEDIRVVLLRLASRTQTLRWYAAHPVPSRQDIARETLEIYAPLANRLGVNPLKWELEDRAFQYLDPAHYEEMAARVDAPRKERERFILQLIERLARELSEAGIQAEVMGRPKHLYSLWNKMQKKQLEFSRVMDLYALRVLVEDTKACYDSLSVVHAIWSAIDGQFDDYIAHPKGNQYQSLHTVVMTPEGRPVEIQIRTHDMHHHAESGYAAHWRYKEGASKSVGDYDEKIALLRELLSWRDEIAGSKAWLDQMQRAALSDTVYVLTPQGRVVDLPQGATPIDFAYRLHTDLGHRCRGAKVEGVLVPLNTRLKNGQRVEVVSAKFGGPSRDWLNPSLGFLVSHRAKQKVREWFAKADLQNTLAAGRTFIHRELAREGATAEPLEPLAARLGFVDSQAMYLAAGRGEIGPRAVAVALRGETDSPLAASLKPLPKAVAHQDGVLVEGVGKLLTHLARCCKPVPPDPIQGFITRGRGVSIHRMACLSYQHMARAHPERRIKTEWGPAPLGRSPRYSVNIRVESVDRQGLLRDISDVLSREKINVTAVRTQSIKGRALMSFTLEVEGLAQLQHALKLISEVPSVGLAKRE